MIRKNADIYLTGFNKGKSQDRHSAGVGLALAKSLTENQNGELRAENRKEGGARFVMTFYAKGN